MQSFTIFCSNDRADQLVMLPDTPCGRETENSNFECHSSKLKPVSGAFSTKSLRFLCCVCSAVASVLCYCIQCMKSQCITVSFNCHPFFLVHALFDEHVISSCHVPNQESVPFNACCLAMHRDASSITSWCNCWACYPFLAFSRHLSRKFGPLKWSIMEGMWDERSEMM